MSLVWDPALAPLYADPQLRRHAGQRAKPRSRGQDGNGHQGLALETAASIYSGAVSDQAIAGYMVISIPIIATAIIKGGEVAFQAVTGVGAVQSARPAKRRRPRRAASPRTRSRWISSSWRRHDRPPSCRRPATPTAPPSRAAARCRRLPLPGQPEPPGQHLHLHRTPGERPGRKRAKPRLGAHRARGHAAQPGHRAEPSARHPGQLRASQQRSGATSTSDGGSTSTQFQTSIRWRAT